MTFVVGGGDLGNMSRLEKKPARNRNLQIEMSLREYRLGRVTKH
jgi:hypothetical protein